MRALQVSSFRASDLYRSAARHFSANSRRKSCIVLNLDDDLIDYETSWRYQKVLTEHIHRSRKGKEPSPCYVLVVEHPSVFTLGRGGSAENLKFEVGGKESADVIRVERGGEVTWHGPGQIVVYPILDLDNHKRDLHWYTSQLEESVIRLLKEEYSINGGRNDVNTGVWVDNNKIAAVGVTASRWITMHGMSLNVNPTMKDFNLIVPCGITEEGYGVCSLQQHLSKQKGTINSTNSDDTMQVIRLKWIDRLVSTFEFEDVQVLNREEGREHVAELLDVYPQIKAMELKPNQL